MTDDYLTPPPAQVKAPRPPKPYPDFPLQAHATGYWAKRIRGKMYYFGKWDDWQGALDKYLEQKDDLFAGRNPKPDNEGATVKDLVNDFLRQKQTRVDVGQLSSRTWDDYKVACDQVVKNFGKRRLLSDIGPEDFAALGTKLIKQYGPHRYGKTIQCVRCLFKFGYDAGLIDKPMRFGAGFERPSKKVLRLHKARQGPRTFTAQEVRRIIDTAGMPLKAMILLGINCGYGNSDCGNLPRSALDIEKGWVDFSRPKTGIERRCPLWSETVATIKASLTKRREPTNPKHTDLVFLTKYGNSWAQDIAGITKEFRKVLKVLDINGHRNFYSLRHTFRTVADGAKDQPAADHIMGHESGHMSTVYRESISDERLRAVTEHVHAWLFGG
jgi:integrase